MTTTASIDPSDLDLRVKGSLPTGPTLSQTATAIIQPPLLPSNPLETVPSSPTQIYLNLLILEASLRSQYLRHLSRRRKFTFFLAVLCLWTAFFAYQFFVLGGSPYYYISHFEKLGLGGGVVTGVLYYATGLYHTTIVESRRFVAITNRGLRVLNVKLVKVPLSYREWIRWWWGWYAIKVPQAQPSQVCRTRRSSTNTRRPAPPVLTHTHSPSLSSTALKRPLVSDEDDDDVEEVEEYLPGGLHLKLVILPKGFSPDFREGWEIYRADYWEKENEIRQRRRRELRKRSRTNYLEVPSQGGPHSERKARSSRAGSISSLRAQTPTPDPQTRLMGRPRKGSAASLKRRSQASVTPKVVVSGDISDSGSTASVLGTGRSDSVRSDRTSPTGSTKDQKRKPSGKGRGVKNIKKPPTSKDEEADI